MMKIYHTCLLFFSFTLSTDAKKSAFDQNEYLEYLGNLYKAVEDWRGLHFILKHLPDSKSKLKSHLKKNAPSDIMKMTNALYPIYNKGGVVNRNKKLIDPKSDAAGLYELAYLFLENRNFKELEEDILLKLIDEKNLMDLVPIQRLLVVAVRVLLDLRFNDPGCLEPWSSKEKPHLGIMAEMMKTIFLLNVKSNSMSLKPINEICKNIKGIDNCLRVLVVGGYKGSINKPLQKLKRNKPQEAQEISICHALKTRGPRDAKKLIERVLATDPKFPGSKYYKSLNEALAKLMDWQVGQNKLEKLCPSSQYRLKIDRILSSLDLSTDTIRNAEKVFWACMAAQYIHQASDALDKIKEEIKILIPKLPDNVVSKLRKNITRLVALIGDTPEYVLNQDMIQFRTNYDQIVGYLMSGNLKNAENQLHEIMASVRVNSPQNSDSLEMAENHISVRYGNLLIGAFKNHVLFNRKWEALSRDEWVSNWFLVQAVDSLSNGGDKLKAYQGHQIPNHIFNKIAFFTERYDDATKNETTKKDGVFYYNLCQLCKLQSKRVCKDSIPDDDQAGELDREIRPKLCSSWRAAKELERIPKGRKSTFPESAASGKVYLQPRLPGDQRLSPPTSKPLNQLKVLTPFPRKSKSHTEKEESISTEGFFLSKFPGQTVTIIPPEITKPTSRPPNKTSSKSKPPKKHKGQTDN